VTASQNGWAVDPVLAHFALPGGTVSLHAGSPGAVLAWVGTRYHNEVQHLVWPGCWGYAHRNIIGSTVISNHASGTALDLDAPLHPLGTEPTANYTAAEIAAIHRIVGDTHGLIRWGGDYTGRKDGMHFEVNDGVTLAQLDALWASLQGHPTPPPAPLPVPAPRPAPGPRNLKRGDTGADVAGLQKALAVQYPAYRHEHGSLVVDGVFGRITDAWVREFQSRSGLVVDGIVGPKTRAKLGL
jgi:peptidoglycan hydrolase-like protein with peptidoglycan-binding domain